MNDPGSIEQAFGPYKFMLGVLIRAHLGGADHDYIGVVLELDEDGRAFMGILRRAASLYSVGIAGDTTLMGLQTGVYLGLIPRPILLALLSRFEAKSTVAALQVEPSPTQMHALWKCGNDLLSLLMDMGRSAAPPAPPLVLVRGGDA